MYVNFDPVAFYIIDLPVRWYAIAYIVGIIFGAIIAKKVAKHLRTFDEKYIDVFINWAVFGIIIGGRLGYILLYEMDFYSQHFDEAFKIWNGGMSFHGGFMGVMLSGFVFCNIYRINYLNLCDALAVAAPVGIFLGRIANFINGELYGRSYNGALSFCFEDNIPRHASQLYEAFFEGIVLLYVLLYLLTKTKKAKKSGFLSGVFCLGYSLARLFCEHFREPDSDFNYLLLEDYGITLGQLLSIPIGILGACLIMKEKIFSIKTRSKY